MGTPDGSWTHAGETYRAIRAILTGADDYSHRRAVEVAIEPKANTSTPHPVTPKEMMVVLNLMSSSPVAMFVKHCSVQQKVMMAAVVRCVRREGLPEIPWRSVSPETQVVSRTKSAKYRAGSDRPRRPHSIFDGEQRSLVAL